MASSYFGDGVVTTACRRVSTIKRQICVFGRSFFFFPKFLFEETLQELEGKKKKKNLKNIF